jgi:hypothetical protein
VTPASILGIVNHQTKRLYNLDGGVPYRNLRVLPGMAIVESLPVYPGAPDKLLRAAAFGGWALVPSWCASSPKDPVIAHQPHTMTR